MQVYFYRANIRAAPAEGGCKGQLHEFFGIPDRHGYCADRTWYGGLVVVSASPPVYGAGIHACSAADAFQPIPVFGPGKVGGPAVVHQDHMHFTSLFGFLVMGCIYCDRLACCTPGQQPDKDAQGVRVGDHLFYAHTVDLNRGHIHAEIRVSLVCTYDYVSGICDTEVDACDRCPGIQEMASEVFPCRIGQIYRICISF